MTLKTVVSEMVQMTTGTEFQTDKPATENARSPNSVKAEPAIIIIIIIIAEFIVRLLQKQEHGALQKSRMCGKTRRKSTDIKNTAKIVRFQQFSKSNRISHGADIVRQCVPGGRTSAVKRTLAEPISEVWRMVTYRPRRSVRR